MSNVDLAQEMTRMIRTQRAFSLASRALATADDMEGIANNMRR
jgi:flagellar basal body rod protein FlgG